ncbi:hypothetical protein DI270_012570 [Microbispora triticiradicis]|uniref:Uncharacterized protein n=1 Tax=Microbispora triticiradicis TaxID=2200763 RepID=A0ABX9LL01_9ACTN|nr:hypothetical protein [Microbispora triticiradicis]RGA04662.1 hypothetical protein DI270_012570 [Microbispora triticiradicis]GLW22687.1 hypothetical protein Mame01_27300 [Microbispora amethystogenes]
MSRSLAALVLAGGAVTVVPTAAEASTSQFGGIDRMGRLPAQAAQAVLKRVTRPQSAWGVGDGGGAYVWIRNASTDLCVGSGSASRQWKIVPAGGP